MKSGRKKSEFTDAEKGQLLSYLQNILTFQTHRYLMYGFIANREIIQFFSFKRHGSDFIIEEYPPIYLKNEGIQYLLYLMDISLSDLGIMDSIAIGKQELIIEQVLGSLIWFFF